MLNLSIPWWEFIVRGVVVYLFLLLTLRLTGKRQIGQLAPFDLVLLLVLSNAVQNSMNGGDNSLIGGLVSAITLIVLNQAVGWITYKSKKLSSVIEGHPQILVHNGTVDRALMQKEKITLHELEAAIRQGGGTDLQSVHFAVLENNGTISILLRKNLSV
jgi:uncharacterized membrane protein YcaP (DUF421 family)